MERETIHLTDELYIETYPFSDYITCVEVYLQGKSFSAFCSDNSIVEEWKENPDLLLQLCHEHMGKQRTEPTPTKNSATKREVLNDLYEIEYYSFSEDVYCINVYQEGKQATSFCSDRASMEEWQEDPASLVSFIKQILK